MAVRTSSAEWRGTLKSGSGTMKVGKGVWRGPYTYASRFESGAGTNPEELIAAAHAGCFSMFLAALLSDAGFTPTRVSTAATVHLDEGPTISSIELDTEAAVAGVTAAAFLELAERAKRNCPVSKALAGPKITLKASLVA